MITPTPETNRVGRENDTQAELAAWELLAEARRERDDLLETIRETLMENLHLADGNHCTLKKLKDASARYSHR